MKDENLIGKRVGGEPYLLGLQVSVADVVRAYLALGESAEDTAEYLGLPQRGVQAALAYANDHPDASAKSAEDHDESSVLTRLGEVAGLLGLLATVIYVAGGLVLALRLQSSQVDWTAVIGQVPREFLLTIGLGQVLFPALLLVSIYVAYRLLRASDIDLPNTRPFRHRATRTRNMFSAAAIAFVILAPAIVAGAINNKDGAQVGEAVTALLLTGLAAAVAWQAKKRGDNQHSKENIRRTSVFGLLFVVAGLAGIIGAGLCLIYAAGLGGQIGYFAPALVAATLAAGLIVEGRARLGRAGRRGWSDERDRRHHWSRPRTVALASALYGGALIVAAITFWPQAVQLPSAKVCTTTGFEERGDLIGTGSGGVYLAELARGSRRIAAYPSDRVEELFIGKDAGRAECDPHGQPPIVLTREAVARTARAATRAKRASTKVASASHVPAARTALLRVALETAAAGDGDFDTARAVNQWVPKDMRHLPTEAEGALAASNRARSIAGSKGTRTQRLRRMHAAARRAARAAKAAAAEARRYANFALAPAK